MNKQQTQVGRLLEYFNRVSDNSLYDLNQSKITEKYQISDFNFFKDKNWMTPEQFCSYVNFTDKKKELAYFKNKAKDPIFKKLLGLVASFGFLELEDKIWGNKPDEKRVLVLQYQGEGKEVPASITDFPGKDWYLLEDSSSPGNRVYLNSSNLRRKLDHASNIFLYSGTVEMMVITAEEVGNNTLVKPRVYKAYTNPNNYEYKKAHDPDSLPERGAKVTPDKINKLTKDLRDTFTDQLMSKFGFNPKNYEFVRTVLGTYIVREKGSSYGSEYRLTDDMTHEYMNVMYSIDQIEQSVASIYAMRAV